MDELTGLQLIERRERLESAAALVLGRMQFEFSRLDAAVGLCAVWVDDGANLQALILKVETMSFHDRLQFIADAVERRVRKPTASYRNYQAWLQRAHTVRLKRNEFVHGRWYVDHLGEHISNVLGLHVSEPQIEHKYTVAELETQLQEVRSLQVDLSRLRQQKPL